MIWGDVLKEVLVKGYEGDQYFNINVILLIGLFFIVLSSLLVNILIFPNYTLKSKSFSNLYTLLITTIILFFVSWILIVLFYSDLYQELDLLGQIKLSVYFYAIVAIYLLPNPVIFWIIALIIYHVILVFFIKFFFIEYPKDLSRENKEKRSKLKRKKKVDINKYNMM